MRSVILPSRTVVIPSGFAWLIWAFFGNADDGPIGDLNWNPTRRDTIWIRLCWWVRNPCHNFTFYVLGVAQHITTRVGRFPRDVFAPQGRFNIAATSAEAAPMWCIPFGVFAFLVGSSAKGLVGLPWYAVVLWALIKVAPLLFAAVVCACRAIGWLPFVSYKGAAKAYAGWREKGNFGLKLTGP